LLNPAVTGYDPRCVAAHSEVVADEILSLIVSPVRIGLCKARYGRVEGSQEPYCFREKAITRLELEATYVLEVNSKWVLVRVVHDRSIVPEG
jgi:hypothetical protein